MRWMMRPAAAGLVCGASAGVWAFRVTLPTTVPATEMAAADAGGLTAAQDAEEKLNAPTDAALVKTLKDFHYDGGLEEGLKKFAAAAGVHLTVNWRAIEAAGIATDAKVSSDVGDVPAERALKQLLTVGSIAELGFIVEDNAVLVSTADDLTSPKYQSVRIYDTEYVDEAHLTELVDLIMTVVAPDSWRERGGTIGSIQSFNGRLVINQTRAHHQEISQLLLRLRNDHLDRTRSYDVHDLFSAGADEKVLEQQETKLLNAIEQTCGAGTWRNDSGTESSAAWFQGKLLVTAPPGVHHEIEHLLTLMRKK